MTIDSTYLVDTTLATVSAETLMTKAFELTHRLDGLKQYNGTAPGARTIAEIREQRNAIVREMQRRSDALERALVEVEVAERVMSRALAAVANDDPDEQVSLDEAQVMLGRGIAGTSALTCTLVKDQDFSDRISRAARKRVKAIREKIGA